MLREGRLALLRQDRLMRDLAAETRVARFTPPTAAVRPASAPAPAPESSSVTIAGLTEGGQPAPGLAASASSIEIAPPPRDGGLRLVGRTERLSLRECRELLPPGFEIADDELERVRDQLYTLAGAVIDAGGHLRPG